MAMENSSLQVPCESSSAANPGVGPSTRGSGPPINMTSSFEDSSSDPNSSDESNGNSRGDTNGDGNGHGNGDSNGDREFCIRRYRLIGVHLCGHHRLLLANVSNPRPDSISHVIETFIGSAKHKKSAVLALDENVPLDQGKTVYCAQCQTCESRAKDASEDEEHRFNQSETCCRPIKSPERPTLELFAMTLRKRGHFLPPTLRQAVPLATVSEAEWNDYQDLKLLVEDLVNNVASGMVTDDRDMGTYLPTWPGAASNTKRDLHKIKALLRIKSPQNQQSSELDADSRLRLRLEIYPNLSNTESPTEAAPSIPAVVVTQPSVRHPPTPRPSTPRPPTIRPVSSRPSTPTQSEPVGTFGNLNDYPLPEYEVEHIEYAINKPFPRSKFEPYRHHGSNNGVIVPSLPSGGTSPPARESEQQTQQSEAAAANEGGLHSHPVEGETTMPPQNQSQGRQQRNLIIRASQIFGNWRLARRSLISEQSQPDNGGPQTHAGATQSTTDLQNQASSSRRQRFTAFLNASMNRRHGSSVSQGGNATQQSDPPVEPGNEVTIQGAEGQASSMTKATSASPQYQQERCETDGQHSKSNNGQADGGSAASSSSKYSGSVIQAGQGSSGGARDAWANGARADDQHSTATQRSYNIGGVLLPVITGSQESTSSAPPQFRTDGGQEYNENGIEQGVNAGSTLRRTASENALPSRASASGNNGERIQRMRPTMFHVASHSANRLRAEDRHPPSPVSHQPNSETMIEAMDGWNHAMEAMEELYGMPPNEGRGRMPVLEELAAGRAEAENASEHAKQGET